jgi:uncharacterized membrane protein YeaQ/YmgE (transglycosylase-associated protein family)
MAGTKMPHVRFLRDRRRFVMSILAWIVLGLLAGFIASQIVNHRGSGLLLDLVLGIIGAMVGGWLFSLFGARPASGLDLYSLIVAIIGSVVVLLLYHALTSGGRSATRY